MKKEYEIRIVAILKVIFVTLLFDLTCVQSVLCVKYTFLLVLNVRRQLRLTTILLTTYNTCTCLQSKNNCNKFAKVNIKRMHYNSPMLILTFVIIYNSFQYIVVLRILSQVQIKTTGQNPLSMKFTTIKYLTNHCVAMHGGGFHHYYYYFLYILVYVCYYITLIMNGMLTRLHILCHVHVFCWTHVDFGVKVVLIVVRCLFQSLLVTYLTTLHCVHTQSVDFYTHNLLLIKDPFNALNNQKFRDYAIPRYLNDCSYIMITAIYTACTCSFHNNKVHVVRFLYCFPPVSKTLQDNTTFVYNVNYCTLCLPLATMYSKSAANLATIIDLNFCYSITERPCFRIVIIHVYLGFGGGGKLCTISLVFNVLDIFIYILGVCSFLLVYSPLFVLMRIKHLYMYWFIYSFMLNYKLFRLILIDYKAERILYSIALVLLISAIRFACTFCSYMYKQFLKCIMKKQLRFSNNSHDVRECLCSYTIIYFNNG